jgi:enoyl-CoA hydratase/carnithine racemase
VPTRLRSTSQDRLLILTLESAVGLPRIERRVLAEIACEMEKLAAATAFSRCVITGTERAFAVGAEISELGRLTAAEAHEFSREGQRVMRLVERSRVPVIAAIQGYCMGGGLDLALACHARIATSDAVFAHPGGSLGILTGWGGTQRLTRLIGLSRAMEMFVTGRRLSAKEAGACGLVTRTASARDLLVVGGQPSRGVA